MDGGKEKERVGGELRLPCWSGSCCCCWNSAAVAARLSLSVVIDAFLLFLLGRAHDGWQEYACE